MEQSTFRLAVYFILAAVLFYLFFFHFAPQYLWKEAPLEVVKKNLGLAETQLGTYVSQNGAFASGYAVHAAGFESPDRAVVFNCNSGLFCCEQGKDCGKPIKWDNSGTKRYFSFSQEKTVPISARCRYENLYICKVFLGEEPAQIKINQIALATKELDLAESNTIKAPFEVENTGKQDMIAMEVKARVFRRMESSEGTAEKIFVREFSKEFPLESGAKQKGELEIEISENGNYEAEITAVEKTDETNYETKVLELKAFGKVETVECIKAELPVQEKQKCVYLLPCKCKSTIECEKHWREVLEIPFEEMLEVESRNDQTQEIVLKYTAKTVPGWCDEKTMECKGECGQVQPPPETRCPLLPCANDLQNCRVWLPCECEQGADFQKCIDAWKTAIGARDFQKGTYNGKQALYVQGTIKRIPFEICDLCGGVTRTWRDCCELQNIGNCGGTNCELPKQTTTPTPTPAQQTPETTCTPKKEYWDRDQINCYVVFRCSCATYGQCVALWKPSIDDPATANFIPWPSGGPGAAAIRGSQCDPTCGDCEYMRPCNGCIYYFEINGVNPNGR